MRMIKPFVISPFNILTQGELDANFATKDGNERDCEILLDLPDFIVLRVGARFSAYARDDDYSAMSAVASDAPADNRPVWFEVARGAMKCE